MGKLLLAVKSLLTYWVVSFVFVAIITSVSLFILTPIGVTLIIGKFYIPDKKLIENAIEFVPIIAVWVGTILWIKEEIFDNHD